MSVLLNIPQSTILKKQLAIAYHAPKLEYAMPPLELLKNRSDTTLWDPPFKDGVEVAVDGMFVRTQHMIKNESTGIPHRLMQSREWSREYDVVKVKVPVGYEYTDPDGSDSGSISSDESHVGTTTTTTTGDVTNGSSNNGGVTGIGSDSSSGGGPHNNIGGNHHRRNHHRKKHIWNEPHTSTLTSSST